MAASLPKSKHSADRPPQAPSEIGRPRWELTMSEQNIEIIKKGYAAFSAGAGETVMSVFDDNLEWTQPGESTISGTYRGKAEVGEFLMRLREKP
jgi:hypothetical protein